MNILARLICGVRGHDRVLAFDPRRIYLRCTSCGHETHGWTPGPPVDVRKVVPFLNLQQVRDKRRKVA